MNARYATLFLAVHLTFCLAVSAQEHLEPEQGMLNQQEWQWEYGQRLREVLMKDASLYHLARIVCIPTREAEWMVTVVRVDPEDFDRPQTYYVECVIAERKLFPPRKSQGVKAKVERAPIDGETAESLDQIWCWMLLMTRYPKEPQVVADGENYHFSRFVPLTNRGLSDPLGGWEQGKIWSPDEESPCGELVAIGEQLKSYAQARPEDRERVQREIREKVAKLGARLKQVGEPGGDKKSKTDKEKQNGREKEGT